MMSYLKEASSFDDWFTQKENLAQGHRLLNCGWRFVERNSGGGEIQDFALLFDNTRVSLIFMVAPGSRICTAKR